MGLTTHYKLKTNLVEAADVRALVETIRQAAHDLPFQEVGEVLEFQGPKADYRQCGLDDPHRWFKIQADAHLEHDGCHLSVTPRHVIGFSAWPGEGCEEANFGFSLFPAHLDVPAERGLKNRRLATHLDGWRWSSFCKSQYASNPDCGGIQNFLRCHLCVVKLLDFIQSTGLATVEVHDEGGYWEHRDLEKLAREVGQWNEFVAGVAGLVKDAAAQTGGTLEAAVFGFQNFERLEAKGRDQLEALRQRRQPNDN